MLTDPYYKINAEIHHRRPAYSYCVTMWTVFMAILTGIFSYYFYSVEVANKCLVQGDSDSPLNQMVTG